jgi:hypothetical protein
MSGSRRRLRFASSSMTSGRRLAIAE